ncbi:MAG: protein kinase [Polyangiaceae bacterium]
MTCPDDATAANYVQGRLDAAEREHFAAHVDGCPRCYATLTELARVFGDSLAPSRTRLSATTDVQVSGFESTAALTPAERSDPNALARPRAPDQSLVLAGERISKYIVESPLGSGGMGRVYVAHDPVLDRRVALKVLKRRVESSSAEAALLTEARAVAALHHPNIVSIFDAGVDGDRLFLAMELVNGPSFTEWVRTHRSSEEIVELVAQVGEGLRAMHEAGLVHRDVKPENILVGNDGRARIGDFGLAARLEAEPGKGAIAGTPAYMSPEQVHARAVDARSDQFSLSVVLFEALVGRRPYVGRSLDDLAWSMTSGKYEDPTEIHAELALTLRRALSTDPDKRFASMRDYLGALRGTASPNDFDPPHVRLNMVFMGLLALAQAVATVPAWTTVVEALTQPDGDTVDPGGETVWWGLGILILLTFTWLPIGALWGSLNAWGLFKRRPWSRKSSLVYAAILLGGCVTTPYALYALYSLTRPSVKRALAPSVKRALARSAA